MTSGLLILIPLGLIFAVWGARALWRLDDARGTLAITSVLAGLGLLVTGATGAMGIVTTVFAETVTLDLPVETFWPGIPQGAEFTGLDADIISGGFDTATVELAGLSGSARAFLAVGIALDALTVLDVLYLVLTACRYARAGSPFAAAVSRTMLIASFIVGTAGILAQILHDIGANIAAKQALVWEGLHETCTVECADISTWWPEWGPAFELNFWPVGAALVLAVLGFIWRHGATLEKETEGLV